MQFTALSTAPISITVDGEEVHVPRFKRGDWKKFAATIDAKRMDRILARFNGDVKKEAEFLSVYVVMPVAPAELRGYVRGDYDGQDFIVRTCLEKLEPKWPKEKIDAFLEESPEYRIEWLAAQLASMGDEARTPPAKKDEKAPPLPETQTTSDPDELGGERTTEVKEDSQNP